MLGQPALVATHGRGDAQRVALLAEQGVAAVARADTPDRARFWEMRDVTSLGRQIAKRVEARHPVGAAGVDAVERDLAHAGHDAHVGDDVRAVGHFDADSGVRRGDRAHDVGHDVHRSIAHAAVEERPDTLMRFGGAHPVVRRPGVVGVLGADEGEVLGAGDVLWVGAVEEAVRQRVLVEPDEGAIRDHLFDQTIVFGIAPVAPHYPVWARSTRDFVNPLFHGRHHWHPPCCRRQLYHGPVRVSGKGALAPP